jgi:aspartate/glutamate racemase
MSGQRNVLGIVGGMGSVATDHLFQRLVALTPPASM